MTRQFLIRPATPSDSGSLSALATQVWLHTYATSGVSAEMAHHVQATLGAERFSTRITDSKVIVLVAVKKDCLIGLAVAVFEVGATAEGLPELDMLYVQTHFLHSGAGTALLGSVQRVAAQRTGSSSICLSVNAENNVALAFYRRHGFVQDGISDFYLGSVAHRNLVLRGPATAITPGWDRIDVVAPMDRDEVAALIACVLQKSVDASAAEKAIFLSSMVNNLDWACHNADACVHLIYRSGQKIVGVILVKQFWHLCALLVLPEDQQRGIGAALIAYALARCRASASSTMVRLNSSRNALGFYLAQGFTVVDGPPAPLGVTPMLIRL